MKPQLLAKIKALESLMEEMDSSMMDRAKKPKIDSETEIKVMKIEPKSKEDIMESLKKDGEEMPMGESDSYEDEEDDMSELDGLKSRYSKEPIEI